MSSLYSSLYYPHTSIQDPALLRNSLLLWDTVTTIVPWENFQPDYVTTAEKNAWALLGRPHLPTDEERGAVHDAVKEFVEGPIRTEFRYSPGNVAPSGTYEIYPEKLLGDTVALLRSRGLIGDTLPNADLPSTRWMGLHLMNILADCCAGEQMARITDEQAAYEALAGLLADKTVQPSPHNTREAVISVTLDVLDLQAPDLERLVEFRQREEKESRGRDYRDLRHRYCDRIQEQIESLRKSKSEAARKAIREKFRADMEEDARLLRGELRTNTVQTALSYTGIASTVLVLAYEAAAHFGCVAAAGGSLTPASASTATTAFTGLLMLHSKFVQSRAELLRKHPMSYLCSLKR
jgi:hypothetical protein